MGPVATVYGSAPGAIPSARLVPNPGVRVPGEMGTDRAEVGRSDGSGGACRGSTCASGRLATKGSRHRLRAGSVALVHRTRLVATGPADDGPHTADLHHVTRRQPDRAEAGRRSRFRSGAARRRDEPPFWSWGREAAAMSHYASVSNGDPFRGLDVRRALSTDDDRDPLLPALQSFAIELASRRPSKWYITSRRGELAYSRPEAVDEIWLGTDLSWAPHQQDSVEINMEVRSWVPPTLRVDSVRLWRLRTAVEVPCDCARDHGNHPVDERRFEGSSSAGLRSASSELLTQLDEWLTRGTIAGPWRLFAGLPSR